MKVSSLKMPTIVALLPGAVTSTNATMPAPQVNGGSSIVLVDSAYVGIAALMGNATRMGWAPRVLRWRLLRI
jgi:hypothetical protein